MFIRSLFDTKIDEISTSEEETVAETKQELFVRLVNYNGRYLIFNGGWLFRVHNKAVICLVIFVNLSKKSFLQPW